MQPDPHTLIDQIRVAGLQFLMTGHTDDFRRIIGPLFEPGTFDTDTCRVYIAHGPAPDRSRVLAACQDAVGTRAFVTRCLAYEGDVIVITPLNTPAGSPATGWDLTGMRLRHLLEPLPDWHLGGSGISSLDHVAQAYRDASNALLSARYTAERAALYSSDIRLASVVGPGAASWAATFLAPLLAQPAGRAEQLVDTVRLGLVFNHSAAAKMIPTGRNVVAKRMRYVGTLLGLNLNRFPDRAALDLALEINATADCNATPSSGTPTLADLLYTPEVHNWAESLLGRLDADTRPLRRTVTTWLTRDGHVVGTAKALGLRPAAIREHLRAAEALLHRRLLGSLPSEADESDLGVVGSGGVYLAAAALGDVEIDTWPDIQRKL
ncbi:hypothetical protein [Kitasatospora aureofaciens]|uniref:hypothetical protein n=1 Tax=Kitasatospora aureofaciens TaxID=1894 RepID=UPI0033C8C0DC